MKCITVLVMCLCLHDIHSSSEEKTESISPLRLNSTSEWNIKLDIFFSKSLPQHVTRSPGSDVRFKCEAYINFTKVEKYTKNEQGIETLHAELPPQHIQQRLLNNVKVYWLKNNKSIEISNKVNVTTKINNITISTNLKIRNISNGDAGNYTCVYKQMYEKKQTSLLKVEDSVDIPTHAPYFPNSNFVNELRITTPDVVSENIKTMNINVTDSPNIPLQKLEPICQEYVGKVCAFHLRAQSVYIPYDTTQIELEEKLRKAIQVTRFSNEISSHCERYALPSLCYSTFPICRNPVATNANFFKDARQVFLISNRTNSADFPEVLFENMPNGNVPNTFYLKPNNISNEMFNYRHNTTILRRVCKKECEILETELCQKEYAIAKRHPHIGQQLTLEECQDLPEDDPDCLKIEIGALMISDDECYWENGSSYLGKVNVASNGLACIEWSKQMYVTLSNYPVLAGRHSYCRNPGGVNEQPWCVVDKDGKLYKQFCNIPKCAHKIWIYIVVILAVLFIVIVGFVVCLICRHKKKSNAAAIRDINLPNADKNIYGNSRLNSPIEMTDLLPNHSNQPHLTRSTRGNGVLRIPQYSLSQIKFLEELGEGAFGKVYKGALKKSGDTQFIAVKALKENASAKTKADFRREIDLISELNHDNIVCIVGVALSEEPLCMLFEFMARGDLHEFLMGRAPPSGKGLPPMRLLNIAHNIASGMQYLASHHYVHRDLAARNCLVSDDFVVKISDFGLSRDIYSSDYYRVQSKSLLPVRWMPPESILYGKFTTESDIWSYGVVLWEIYSYGLQPYYGYSNQEVISMVRSGEFLAAPSACPLPMYELMRDCWKHTPHRRPSFEDIVNRVQEWIQMGGCSDVGPSESSSNISAYRTTSTSRDLQERVPLLPPHCSSSNGSLTTGSLKKFSVAGSSSKVTDDNCSTCSEVPPLAPKSKKHSAASLIDSDKISNMSTRDTIIRIPNAQHGNEI